MITRISSAGIFFLIIFVAGCLYIPPLGEQTSKEDLEKDIMTLNVGTTTRAEIIERFGKPDLLEEGRFMLYSYAQNRGLLLLVGNAPGAAGLFDLGGEHQVMLMEFDEHEILKRYEIETSTRNAFSGQTGSDDQTQPEAGVAPRVLIENDNNLTLAAAYKLKFYTVALSTDGNMVAVGDGQGQVRLLNLITNEKFIFTSQISWLCPGYEWSLEFSPDGTMLAFLTTSGVSVFNMANRQTIVNFKGHGDCGFSTFHIPTAMAFSPDGKTIATGDNEGVIKIWDPATGAEIKSIQAHKGMIRSIAYSADGRVLATASQDPDASVKIWDIGRLEEQAVIKRMGIAVRFSPDGEVLAIHLGTHVELWDVVSRASNHGTSNHLDKLIDVLIVPVIVPGQWGWALRPSLAFSPGGDRIAASFGGVMIYDLVTSKYVWRYIPDVDKGVAITDLVISPDSKYLLAAEDRSVFMWSLTLKK